MYALGRGRKRSVPGEPAGKRLDALDDEMGGLAESVIFLLRQDDLLAVGVSHAE